MNYFHLLSARDLGQITRVRRYETKLGERLRTLPGTGGASSNGWKDLLAASTPHYVIIGIPDDIGVKANGGTAGTSTAWPAFLEAFVNIQSTDLLSGEDVLLLGAFDFAEVDRTIVANARDAGEALQAYRHAVSGVIDEAVEQVVKTITAAGKVPIAIGGGHNNAYPLIKGAAKGWKQAAVLDEVRLSVVNLDAHADFRIAEGRHSGNAFRYALDEGFLRHYSVVALHENYNSQSMMDDLFQNTQVHYTTYEDIFIREKMSFVQAVQQALAFAGGGLTGIELDLDAVESVLSSAQSPVGVSTLEARQYLSLAASALRPAYLHLAEGAARLEDGRQSSSLGKLLAYLVADFLKGRV